MKFNREIFFDSVRGSLFNGSLTQQQVDGMNYKLSVWEDHPYSTDLRWLSYPLATSKHETASTMWPIEEYGKGKGMSYGVKDPETGQTYYGRGDVQLTWRDNYTRADRELGFSGADSLEWHADRALDPAVSADVMYKGMVEGWFRQGRYLAKYFNATTDDAFGARDIINGDMNKVPSWSNGVKIGTLIAGYHDKFLAALKAAQVVEPVPVPETVEIALTVPAGLNVVVTVNGVKL